jgi:hypothetical protein
MASEFYANMKFIDNEGAVLCRGKYVRISAPIINEYYGLGSAEELYTEWVKLKGEAGLNVEGQLVGGWQEIVRAITQSEYSLEEILPAENWGHIDKKYLTMEMNVWYSFVASRLLPVSINSEVQWERIRLLYALKKHIAIDVGSLIFSSMQQMLPTTSGLGFHSLITALCHRAGCKDKLDDILKSPMGILTYEAFKRRGKLQPRASPDEGIATRMARLERDVQYIKSLCEHTAKVCAQQFPEAVQAVGPYPAPPAADEVTPISIVHPPNTGDADADNVPEDGGDEQAS